MATLVSKIIDSAGGGGVDYTSPQAWETALPADLVALDEEHVGLMRNSAEYTGVSALLLISGQATDATRKITLKCDTGHSFRDHANVRTNPLFYNAANGVGMRVTGSYTYCIRVETDNVTIEDLQIAAPDIGGGIGVQWSGSNFTLNNCIVYARQPLSISGGPSGGQITQCELISRNGSLIGTGAGGTRFEFCGIVRTSNGGTVGTVQYATFTVENCSIFNFTTGFVAGTAGTLAGGFNCTDLASAPGTNNQVSKTFSSQFENTATDFRAKATGTDLENNGTPAPTYATVDISGLTRSASTPWIGPWEHAASGGNAPRAMHHYRTRRAA